MFHSIAPYELIFAFVFNGAVVLALAVIIGGSVFGSPPSLTEVRNALPLMLFAGLYTLPMLFLTIGPVKLRSPARVGILLLGEVVIGVASAALLSGDPFGMREAMGAILILSAAAVEVSAYSPRTRKSGCCGS